MVKLSDLPAEVQARVLKDAGVAKRKGAAKGGGSTAYAGWCRCGVRFDNGAAWVRHGDELGPEHRRFVCDVGQPAPPVVLTPTPPAEETNDG